MELSYPGLLTGGKCHFNLHIRVTSPKLSYTPLIGSPGNKDPQDLHIEQGPVKGKRKHTQAMLEFHPWLQSYLQSKQQTAEKLKALGRPATLFPHILSSISFFASNDHMSTFSIPSPFNCGPLSWLLPFPLFMMALCPFCGKKDGELDLHSAAIISCFLHPVPLASVQVLFPSHFLSQSVCRYQI